MESKEMKLLQGIDTVIVRVTNIGTSKDWYVQKLGLTPVWEEPNMNLIVLDANGATRLTLWQTNQKLTVNRDTASYPIFRTPDAHALQQELKNRGIETGEIIQDDSVSYFFFYDPDGNILEACQVHT